MRKGGHRGRAFISDARPLFFKSGFTLVEMAVVLVVIGLIILTVFPALNAVRTSSQRSLTQANLQALMRATAAYVQANGCVPCPMFPTAVGLGFGRVGTATSAASTAPACGTCVDPTNGGAVVAAKLNGIPPYMSLGLPASVARDGWGHWITMRVDPALTGSNTSFAVTVPPTASCQCSDFSPTSTPAGCTATAPGTVTTPSCLSLNASQKGLCRSALSTTNRITVQTVGGTTQQAAVIFVSTGASGYGSYRADPSASLSNGTQFNFPTSIPACASGGYARCNADGDAAFVDASNITGSIYDDMLVYADRNSLVSMLGNGACQTSW